MRLSKLHLEILPLSIPLLMGTILIVALLFLTPRHLTFSDSAKFAEAAANLVSGRGYVIHHSFFSLDALSVYTPGSAFTAGFLPFQSYFLSAVFNFFPPTDFTVYFIGMIVFILLCLTAALLAWRLHSKEAAIVSFLLLISNLYFLDYAGNFSTEILFTLEILLFILPLLLPGYLKLLSLLPLLLMFFTRQQAPVFLGSVFLFSLYYLFSASLLDPRLKRYAAIAAAVLGLLLLLASVFGKNNIFSPAYLSGALAIKSGIPQGEYLRGTMYQSSGYRALLVKIFYNLYNFLKAPDRLVNPLILAFSIPSLFIPLYKTARRFILFTFLSFILFLFAASATLPNARYVHPVVPLLIISASIALVEVSRLIDSRFRSVFLALVVSLAMLPALGKFTLDARFDRSRYNLSQPPVYQVIAKELHDRVPANHLVITNLDAWGAWYYGSTTMWFPLSPDHLKDHRDKVKYIFITNYLENDGDFALGEWAEVVYRPENIANSFLKDNYTVADTFVIPAAASYHNQEIKATLLIRRD